MTGRDSVGEAIVHVREYPGNDPVALEYWARMLAAEVESLRLKLAVETQAVDILREELGINAFHDKRST